MSEIPGLARTVCLVLRSLGYLNAYNFPVSPRVCCEPVVVSCGSWERESLQADGRERGQRPLEVCVCCDDAGDAETTAAAISCDLSSFGWAALPSSLLPAARRVVACDAAQPEPAGRDATGHWLWKVPLTLTVVIGHD
jgi:DNA-binding transcriptional LysR family regulator